MARRLSSFPPLWLAVREFTLIFDEYFYSYLPLISV